MIENINFEDFIKKLDPVDGVYSYPHYLGLIGQLFPDPSTMVIEEFDGVMSDLGYSPYYGEKLAVYAKKLLGKSDEI